MKKRILSLILCIVIVLSMSSLIVTASIGNTSYNEENIIQPRFTYIQSADTDCSISDGKVYAMADIIAYPSASSCKAVAKLYRRPAGSTGSWTYIATFSDTGTNYALATGKKTALSGYEYRVYASVTAYTSNGASETTSFYSKIAR